MHHTRLAFLIASTSIALCGVATAQAPAAPTTPEAESEAGLDEITVTAQRRAENLQDVPLSVTALTSAEAAKLGVVDLVTLGQAVPGFQMGRQAYAGIGFIRGVGSTGANIGQEPPVAAFVDDVYIPSSPGSLFEFNNIESVEVLKGPQGTLFGRNATGGVVHVHTRNPTETPTVDAAVTYGNFDTFNAQFYGSTAVTDGLAVNLATYYINQNEGWGRNIATNEDVFTKEAFGVRGKALYDLDANTSFLLTAAYDRRDSDEGMAYRVPAGVLSRGGYNPQAAGAGFYDSTSNDNDGFTTISKLFSGKITHDFGPATLVSITAYGDIHVDVTVDSDTTPSPFIRIDAQNGGKTFTQEFQLLSPEDSPISWILGGYYYNDRSFFKLISSGQALPIPVYARTDVVTESFSGFAQTTVEILPKTNLTLGLRYNSDERVLHGVAVRNPTVFGPFDNAKTFESVTGRFAVDHKLNDDVMIYAAYNRGFKSGVFNLGAITAGTTAAPAAVLPEELDAFSVGLKSEWFDRRFRLNAEAYHYDYKNVQTQNVLPVGTVLTNGGAATIYGLDVNMDWLATDNLSFSANIALADGTYDEFLNGLQFFPLPPNAPIAIPAGCAATVPTYPAPAGAAPSAQRACDLSGNDTIQTVPLATTISANYNLPTTVGDFDFNVSWAHGGDFYWEAGNDPNSLQKKTDVINANVQWWSPSDRFGIRLWGKNLTEEEYFTYAANSSTSNFKYSPAEPRTYGVTVLTHF